MIRRLHEKFEVLSKPVRLIYVSIASVTFIMLIMTMIAVEANRQMFARFADDMVKFIGEDMTKQIEGSLDLSIQPVINFHDFDNTTGIISKKIEMRCILSIAAELFTRLKTMLEYRGTTMQISMAI